MWLNVLAVKYYYNFLILILNEVGGMSEIGRKAG